MINIFLRAELNKFELRSPLSPYDIKLLVNNGFIIYIEKSDHRIFCDAEYEKYGAILTNKKWYELDNTFLIIGLKELDNLEYLNNHTHIYFSHSYKNQHNSNKLLNAFINSKSILYDFEYFIDKTLKIRVISFGFYAGIVGGILGIKQYIENIKSLKIWENQEEMIDEIEYKEYFKELKIALIGYNGNCGSGVKYILNKISDKLNITYIGRNDSKSELYNYDIVYNCIKLDKDYNEVWIDENNIKLFNKKIIIVDISRDSYKDNNPIKLYIEPTKWDNPVLKYNENINIIAIDNLPSLLPYDSSIYFSKLFCNLLLNYNKYKDIWDVSKQELYNAYKNMNNK
jgi:saccharopine dehydrogenase (NAD+, L-lysine-forming)